MSTSESRYQEVLKRITEKDNIIADNERILLTLAENVTLLRQKVNVLKERIKILEAKIERQRKVIKQPSDYN